MLHFLPNYYFFASESQCRKRLRTHTPRGFPRRNKNMQCYTGVIFSGIYISKTHREKPSEKKRQSRHIPTPHADSARHCDVNVTCKTSHVTSQRINTASTSETQLKNQIRSTLNHIFLDLSAADCYN